MSAVYESVDDRNLFYVISQKSTETRIHEMKGIIKEGLQFITRYLNV